MQISPALRQGISIGVGAALGMTTAIGAAVAFTADDADTRRVGGIVAGAAFATGAGVGALMLRSPALRHDAALGAMGFLGLPSLIATGLIQNRRDM